MEERVGLDIPGLTASSRIPPPSIKGDADARIGAEKPGCKYGTQRRRDGQYVLNGPTEGVTDLVVVVSANLIANNFNKESKKSENDENCSTEQFKRLEKGDGGGNPRRRQET
jgi:hypothetical protein